MYTTLTTHRLQRLQSLPFTVAACRETRSKPDQLRKSFPVTARGYKQLQCSSRMCSAVHALKRPLWTRAPADRTMTHAQRSKCRPRAETLSQSARVGPMRRTDRLNVLRKGQLRIRRDRDELVRDGLVIDGRMRSDVPHGRGELDRALEVRLLLVVDDLHCQTKSSASDAPGDSAGRGGRAARALYAARRSP